MNIKRKAINGLVWAFSQQFSVQLINFGVQIVLARLLMPEDFGLIAMLTVFINLGQMLMDGGMTSSLIRMKRPDQLDYSTVFVANFIISIFVYLIIFSTAPFISRFYGQEVLKDILQVYALTFVIRSFVAVHVAKLTKEMNFKSQMKLQIPSTIVGAIVGICMAFLGYGVWSLVWMNLIQTVFFTFQYWIFIKWRPSLIFNKRRFKYHFSFGYKLTLSSLLDTIYNDAYRIVIGKFFSPASVGYFNHAETTRLFPVQQLSLAIGKVTYPLFANIKSDDALRFTYRSTMKLVLFVVIPVMLILIIIAEEGFLVLFGEKWLPAVQYFQILAVASIVRPISTYNLNVLKVKGRSDLFLQVEIIKKVIGVLAMFIGFNFGIMGLVISLTIVSFVFVWINMFFCGRLIDYSVVMQIKDIKKMFLVGLGTFFIVSFFRQSLIAYMSSEILVILLVSICYLVLYFSVVLLIDKELKSLLIKLVKNK